MSVLDPGYTDFLRSDARRGSNGEAVDNVRSEYSMALCGHLCATYSGDTRTNPAAFIDRRMNQLFEEWQKRNEGSGTVDFPFERELATNFAARRIIGISWWVDRTCTAFNSGK